MDLQFPHFGHNELTAELERLVQVPSDSTRMREFLLLLKRNLENRIYPQCSQCNRCLFNTVCLFFFESKLYCEECAQIMKIEKLKAEQEDIISQCAMIDLGQKILGLKEWTLGDHFQFTVLSQPREGSTAQNRLSLGSRMYNKKIGAEVLQYLKQIEYNKIGFPEEKWFASLSGKGHFYEAGSLDVQFQCIPMEEEKQKEKRRTIFDQYKRGEDILLEELKAKIRPNHKNKSDIDFLNKLTISEAERNIGVYQTVLSIHSNYQTGAQIKPEMNTSKEITEDLTYNDDMKNQLLDDYGCSEKDRKQRQLMKEFQKLMDLQVKVRSKRRKTKKIESHLRISRNRAKQ